MLERGERSDLFSLAATRQRGLFSVPLVALPVTYIEKAFVSLALLSNMITKYTSGSVRLLKSLFYTVCESLKLPNSIG